MWLFFINFMFMVSNFIYDFETFIYGCILRRSVTPILSSKGQMSAWPLILIIPCIENVEFTIQHWANLGSDVPWTTHLMSLYMWTISFSCWICVMEISWFKLTLWQFSLLPTVFKGWTNHFCIYVHGKYIRIHGL